VPHLDSTAEQTLTVAVPGATLAVKTAGDPQAPAVLLVHGFASSRRDNWMRTRWLPPLVDAGFRVVAPDLRGHGDSSRPRRLTAYSVPRFVADLVAVLDAADARVAHVVGYSLGARLAWELAARHPERVASLVVGGPPVLGSFAGFDLAAAQAALRASAGPTPALESATAALRATGEPVPDARPAPAASPNASPLNSATARYLAMATMNSNDPDALLRVAEAVRRSAFDPRRSRSGHPLLVVAGDDDEVAEASRALAADLDGRFVGLAGRDHVSAVTSRVFKDEVVAFLTAAEQARRADAGRPTPGRPDRP
jgi:pimeloyl-ACP methyl ester carboxylesterase